MKSQTSGRTSAARNRSRWLAKRSASRRVMPAKAVPQPALMPRSPRRPRRSWRGTARPASPSPATSAAVPTASTVPSCRITTPSSGATSSKTCVAQRVETPSSAISRRTSACSSARARRSRPAVASSRSRSSGRCRSARAISARRCWPPESAFAFTAARSARPTSASTSAIRARAVPPADPVQRRVVGEVLPEREVAVERPALEHHADAGERLAGLAARVETRDLDPAGGAVVEPGDEREERGLAGAVDAEEGGEGAARHGEAHVAERLEPPEPVAHACHGERRRAHRSRLSFGRRARLFVDHDFDSRPPAPAGASRVRHSLRSSSTVKFASSLMSY